MKMKKEIKTRNETIMIIESDLFIYNANISYCTLTKKYVMINYKMKNEINRFSKFKII